MFRVGDRVKWTGSVTGKVMRGTIRTIDSAKIKQGTFKTMVGGHAIVQTDGGEVGLPLGNLEHDD